MNDDFGLGLGLEERANDDPAEKLWEKIRYECNKDNKRQIAEYKQSIADRIGTLTTCHRVLMQHGASDEELEKYRQEIDELIQEEAFWR